MRRLTFGTLVLAAATTVAGHRADAQSTGQTSGYTTGQNLLWACYVPTTGTTYRIRQSDLRQDCSSSSHVMFSWNEQGIQGPAGPAGPVGATGAQGPQGPAGMVDFAKIRTIYKELYTKPDGGLWEIVASCPTGMHVLDAGYFTNLVDGVPQSAFAGLRVIDSYIDEASTTYRLFAVNVLGGGELRLVAVVRCI